MSLKLVNGVYHWRKMIQGHKFSQSTRTSDPKVAANLAILWEADAIKEIMVKGTKPVMLHDVIKAFLSERVGTGAEKNSEQHLRHFRDALPNVRMSELQQDKIQAVVSARRATGIAHNTLVVMVSYWNALVKFAEDKKWTTGPKLPRMKVEQTRLRYITVDEERRLLEAVSPDAPYRGKCPATDEAKQENHDLLVMIFALGLRFSEAGSMTWSQVDLNTRKIMVRRVKNGIDNTMMMTDKLHSMLLRRRATVVGEYIYPHKTKNNSNHTWFRAALKRAGISEDAGKLSLHSGRHTFASRNIIGGMALQEVQSLLGHANISSTLVYSHIQTGAVAEKSAGIMNAY